MTTPNTQPTELDKAIKEIEDWMNGKGFSSIHYELKQLILAANRLKNVEKVNKAYSEVIGTNAETIFSLQQCLEEVEKECKRQDKEYAALYQYINQLRVEYKQVLETSRALIKRMRVVYASPEYKVVWSSYMIHGGDYSKGPKWVNEFDALEALFSTPLAIEMMKGEV